MERAETLRPPGKPEGPERKEDGPIRRSYELRDAAGRLTGILEAEYDDQPEAFKFRGQDGRNHVGTGLRLDRLVLKSATRPEAEQYDLLVHAAIKRQTPGALDLEPRRAEVVVADERYGDYYYSSGEHRVVVPPPETAADIAILLHELGHSQQYQDPRFDLITGRYRSESDQDVTWETVRAAIDTILLPQEMGPAVADITADEAMESLSPLVEEVMLRELKVEGLEQRFFAARDALLEVGLEMRTPETEEMSHELYAARNELERSKTALSMAVLRAAQGSGNLKKLAKLPTIVMERNATAHAFKWMRDIRKRTGVDLFADGPSESGKKGDETGCATDMRLRLLQVQESMGGRRMLRDALGSYGAERAAPRQAMEIKRSMDEDRRRAEGVRRIIYDIGGEETKENEMLSAEYRSLVEASRRAIKEATGMDIGNGGKKGGIARKILETRGLFSPRLRALYDSWKKNLDLAREHERMADEAAGAAEPTGDAAAPEER